METINLRERVRVSLNNLKQKGIILGRPVGTKEDESKLLKKYPDVVKYIELGLSIREVSKLTKLSKNKARTSVVPIPAYWGWLCAEL